MSEHSRQDLREISHLFLSGVRDRQTGGAARPVRIGPAQRADLPPELTPEELQQVSAATGASASDHSRINMTAVLASHFESRQDECVRQYATQVAAAGVRVGLIEIDAGEFKLTLLEAGSDQSTANETAAQPMPMDGRRIAEALEELSWDVEQWILSIGGYGRSSEAREMLRRVSRFTLISSCDPDGIVAAYRTLKGAADLFSRAARPRLGLAVIDTPDAAMAPNTYEKINGVAMQFLAWPLEMECAIDPAVVASEHVVLNCRGANEKPGSAGLQWKIVAEFLDRAVPTAQEVFTAEPHLQPLEAPVEPPMQESIQPNFVLPQQPMASAPNSRSDDEEILELSGGDDAGSILSSVLAGAPQRWIECPVRPPMCDEARLAVSRDRALTLMAVANRGLGELRQIGQAYQWLTQNRSLVAMALPQLAIDAHQPPQLMLLVDHADSTADALQPLLHAGHVTVTAYRKVRFSGRRGLLLEAA